MISSQRPAQVPQVIVKQVHFRTPITRKRTLINWLAKKGSTVTLAWLMNELLRPFLLLVELGIDPYPMKGRSIESPDPRPISPALFKSMTDMIQQRELELAALRQLLAEMQRARPMAEAA